MPSEDLSSISSLQDNHRRGLVRKLGITSVRALADADPDAICTELQNLRPPPSRGQVLRWQREARNMLSDADSDWSEWQRAASFAVIFNQRQANGGWERRLEVEQTEAGPTPPHQEWPHWDCKEVCDWMRGYLPASQTEPEAGAADETEGAPASEPAAGVPVSRAERAELRIDSATITDAAAHELALIAAGDPTGTPPGDLTPPVRLKLTVSGRRRGQQVQATVWFLRHAEPGWSPQEPVTIAASGRAEFDLSAVPTGEHQIRLVAWATDAGATLAGVTLPTLTFLEPAP